MAYQCYWNNDEFTIPIPKYNFFRPFTFTIVLTRSFIFVFFILSFSLYPVQKIVLIRWFGYVSDLNGVDRLTTQRIKPMSLWSTFWSFPSTSMLRQMSLHQRQLHDHTIGDVICTTISTNPYQLQMSSFLAWSWYNATFATPLSRGTVHCLL